MEPPIVLKKFWFNNFKLLHWKEYVEIIFLDKKYVKHLTSLRPYPPTLSTKIEETIKLWKVWLLNIMEAFINEHYLIIPICWRKIKKLTQRNMMTLKFVNSYQSQWA